MFQNSDKNNFLYVILIIVMGTALRVYGIDNVLLDYASFRQTYTAMIARNFYLHGIHLLNPQIDILGIKNISEFPLYPALVSLVYKMTGVQEIVGRIISILFFIPATFHLFRIARTLFDDKTALYAILLYSLFPMMIYYTRTFMLESMMMYLCLASVDFLLVWHTNRSRKYSAIALGSSILFLALAIILKIPVMYLLFVFGFIFYRNMSTRAQWIGYGLLLLLAITPALFWYFVLPELSQAGSGIIDSQSSVKSSVLSADAFLLRLFLYSQAATWRKLFIVKIFDYQITPIGTLLIFIWIVHLFYLHKKQIIKNIWNFLRASLKTKIRQVHPSNMILLIWVAGFLVFMVLFPVFNILHEYYQIPILAPMSILLARILIRLQNDYQKFPGTLSGSIILFFVLLSFYSGYKINDRLQVDKEKLYISQKVKKIVPKDQKITIIDSLPRPEIFYYSQRSGFIMPVFAHGDQLPSRSDENYLVDARRVFQEYKAGGSQFFVIPEKEYPLAGMKFIKIVQQKCPKIWQKNSTDLIGIYSMKCTP